MREATPQGWKSCEAGEREKKGVGGREKVLFKGRSYSKWRQVTSQQRGKPFKNPSPGKHPSLTDLPEDRDVPHLPGAHLSPGALGDVLKVWNGRGLPGGAEELRDYSPRALPVPARRGQGPGCAQRCLRADAAAPGARAGHGRPGRRRSGSREEAFGIPGSREASSCPAAAGGPAWAVGCSPRSGAGICKCSALPGAMV